ncbi:hypothetical protein F5888DRAFT_1705908 [Russula emetica]|nr:hypothetical protein F5888DRAFT_1705908 [Russula emetica]
MEGFRVHSTIVLSTHKHFDDGTISCGTVIETLEGWVVSWKNCVKSPAALEPYLNLMGVITVGKVDQRRQALPDTLRSISNLIWNVRNAPRVCSDNPRMHPYQIDYVKRVILHLCDLGTISPRVARSDLDTCIMVGVINIGLEQESSGRIDIFPVVPILEDEDIAFGWR